MSTLYNEDQVREIIQMTVNMTLKAVSGTNTELYLTTAEVVKRFKTSVSTLHRLKNAGILHPVQLGRLLKWKTEELINQFNN